MGYIDKELGIKSVSGITKYLKKYLSDNGYGNIDLDCVKVDSSVRCFWSVNNTLHKFDMKANNIYTIQSEYLNTLISAITNTLTKSKTPNGKFTYPCPKCKSGDCDNIGNQWRCNKCNERWTKQPLR